MLGGTLQTHTYTQARMLGQEKHKERHTWTEVSLRYIVQCVASRFAAP